VRPTGEITSLLAALRQGDPHAKSRLMDLAYEDLHELARRQMRRERPDHTLQPTALVHETYMRLMGGAQPLDWHDRAHFFATAATVMRRVLVDHVRQRSAAKRPSAGQKVELQDFLVRNIQLTDQVLIIDEALNRMAEWNPRHAKVVEMIYFGGLTEEEAAAVLMVSVRTVKRDWSAARAWLQAELGRKGA
jgi:RNA polymerase sigma-70 factor (ECF subfamily)